jgi:DNA-directed RNA polymerase omega subunit
VQELPEGVDSKFRYVLLVAKRAEQLIQGAAPKLKTKHAKATRVAMDEIDRREVQWQFEPPTAPDSLDDLLEAE